VRWDMAEMVPGVSIGAERLDHVKEEILATHFYEIPADAIMR